MATSHSIPRRSFPRSSLLVEAASLVLGTTATIGLFFAIAHFKGGNHEAPAAIEEMKVLSLPPEPPPKIFVPSTPVEVALPFAGLEVAASDSPVKIAVLPPDLDAMVPKSRIPPSAVIQTTQLFPDLKPKMNISVDFQRIFQPSEVDQRTAVLSRPDPRWPHGTSKDVHTLKLTFLLIVNVNGSAEGIRLLTSSGNPEFDQEVEAQIRDAWVFSPALKNGKRVRCMVQQTVVVSSNGSSPFRL